MTTTMPVPSIPPPARIMGWVPYWDQETAWESVLAHRDVVDTVGFFWYALLTDGSLGPYPYATLDRSLVTTAEQYGMKTLVVIANLPTENEHGDWDPERVQRVIATPTARQQHIADIVQLVDEYNFDGVNIDYEALRGNQRADFSQFIEELATALHQRHKILGISLAAKAEEDSPRYSNGSEAQDWAYLAEHADQLYVMAYNEHWETSNPGAVASLPWATTIMSYAASQIPPDKLFAGMPLYGYDWGETPPAIGLTHQAVTKLMRRWQAKQQWDASAQSPFFTYQTNNESHTVWFEDTPSLQAKLTAWQRLGVRNVALWRLGGEEEASWEALGIFKTSW